MDTGLSTQLLAMRSASTQGSIEIAVIKKQHEMDMSLIALLTDATKAPPPAGQGLRIDKSA